jgi:hypothetical protein
MNRNRRALSKSVDGHASRDGRRLLRVALRETIGSPRWWRLLVTTKALVRCSPCETPNEISKRRGCLQCVVVAIDCLRRCGRVDLADLESHSSRRSTCACANPRGALRGRGIFGSLLTVARPAAAKAVKFTQLRSLYACGSCRSCQRRFFRGLPPEPFGTRSLLAASRRQHQTLPPRPPDSEQNLLDQITFPWAAAQPFLDIR